MRKTFRIRWNRRERGSLWRFGALVRQRRRAALPLASHEDRSITWHVWWLSVGVGLSYSQVLGGWDGFQLNPISTVCAESHLPCAPICAD